MDKKLKRAKRAKKIRSKIELLEVNRLSVHRTLQHIYAQIIAPNGKVLLAVSSLDKGLRDKCPNGGNIAAAALVGKALGERAVADKISNVAFDRSGFRYHGRIKALAEAAREAGLEF